MGEPALVRPAFTALLRQDFKSYLKWAFVQLKGKEAFSDAMYIDYLCDKIQMFLDHHHQRVLVSLPPRYLKSMIISVCLPTWLLGHFPGWKVVIISYSQEVAEEKGRDCLHLMQCEGYRQIFPHTRISPTKNAAGEFETTAKGGILCTSIGGAITGRGADVILIDDPIKAQDAHSLAALERVLNFFNHSAITRLNDKKKGIVIVNMQRLAVNDLIGALKDNHGFETISFSVIAEYDQLYRFNDGREWHRKKGDLLNPLREPMEVVEQQRKIMGENAFMAQYMQRPLLAQNVFLRAEYFQDYKDLPISIQQSPCTYISVDTATKVGENNDFTAIAVVISDSAGRNALYYVQEV